MAIAIVAVIPGNEPKIIPTTTPVRDISNWVIPNVNISIALLLYGNVILKSLPNMSHIRVEETTDMIREFSKERKSRLDQNFRVLKATGIDASCSIPTNSTLNRNRNKMDAGRNPRRFIAGKYSTIRTRLPMSLTLSQLATKKL